MYFATIALSLQSGAMNFSSISFPSCSSFPSIIDGEILCFNFRGRAPSVKIQNASFPRFNSIQTKSGSVDINKCKSNLQSSFCYDKAIPEEIIERPVGLSISERNIGDNPCCNDCQAKGAVLCSTCSGSGLYIDSILESQGIMVKVRCLGCGGTGNIMCSACGGRGHLRVK